MNGYFRCSQKQGMQTIRGLFDELKSGAKPDLDKAHAWVDVLVGEISQKAESRLNLLQPGSLEEYIFVHSVNVSVLAAIMAFKNGVTEVNCMK
jgi:HD-GYP domain-containing protein (c-di-GMP phosphodiesterase class II)